MWIGWVRLSVFLLLAVNVDAIREDDDYDDVGIAENDMPEKVAPEKEDPKTMHEDATKLEKYLASKAQSSLVLPEDKVRLNIYPYVENFLLREDAQTLSVSLRLCSFWMDPRLRWDPKAYDDQYRVFMNYWEVWSPQFVAINSVKPLWDYSDYSRIHVNRLPNHFYLYRCPSVRTVVDCKVDAASFPYDRQNCSIILADKHFGKNFDMEFANKWMGNTTFELGMAYKYFNNRTHFGPWEMIKMNYKAMTLDNKNNLHAMSENRTGDNLAYVLTILLEREATFYTTTFLIPAFVFLSITAFAFMAKTRFLTLTLVSMNLILLALFITSSFKRFPIHYSVTPRIVAFWQFEVLITIIQWFLCVTLIILPKTRFAKKGSDYVVFDGDDGEISIACIRAKFFTLGTLFFALSLLMSLILLTPTIY